MEKIIIPNIVPPYPDELLYSWVKRLAEENSMSFYAFHSKFFLNSIAKYERAVPLDLKSGFMNFYNALNIKTDAMDLFFKLSTIQFDLMFFPKSEQIPILNTIFGPKNDFYKMSRYVGISDIKICSKCIEEDVKKYGEWYIHRSHNLNGVCRCHKHHDTLHIIAQNQRKYYDGKDDYWHQFASEYSQDYQDPLICDYENYKKENNGFIIESTGELCRDDEAKYINEVNYAIYANWLSEKNILNCQENLIGAIQKKAKKCSKDNQSDKMATALVHNILAEHLLDTTRYPKGMPSNPSFFIPILLKLFPDINELENTIEKYMMLHKEHCEKCGNDYYINDEMKIKGFECVYCDANIPVEDLIKRLVQKCGKNGYDVITSSDSFSIKNTLHHKLCDKDMKCNLNSFLFKNVRCSCEQKLTREEAEKRIKKFKRFKLIEFSGSSHPAKIYHKDCGQEFEINAFRDFVETPKCRCCEIQPDITQEIFEQEVRDVVGDEYTVLGQVSTRDGKVLIRHNKCGEVQYYKVFDFLTGSRCAKCYSKASDKKLKTMLFEYADDRYEIVGKDKYRVHLYDHIEKKEIKLKFKHIVQELLRPTPSSILPTDKCLKIEKALNTFDYWYMLCKEYKNEFGHLYLEHNEKYQEHALGYWCSETRIAYNRGELSQEQIDALNEIGFIWDVVFYLWNKRFEEYKAYVKETGNYFPRTDCIHNGNKVGSWFLGQRKERKRGNLNPIYEKILLDYYPDFFKERDGWLNRKDKV